MPDTTDVPVPPHPAVPHDLFADSPGHSPVDARRLQVRPRAYWLGHVLVLGVLVALALRPVPSSEAAASGQVSGFPACSALGTGQHREACRANVASDRLRAQIIEECRLRRSTLERQWWQDSATTIQFNYAGEAGLTKGASIDVYSGEVTYCR